MKKSAVMTIVRTRDAMNPEFPPKPGVADFSARRTPVTAVDTGDDRDPGGNPPQVVVLLHDGGVQTFRAGIVIWGTGAGSEELND